MAFTTERVKGLRKIIDKINPELAFIPTLYYPQLVEAKIVDSFRPFLDGALFPYRYESSGRKELRTSTAVVDEMEEVQRIWGKQFPIYLDFYASPHSTAGSTTVQYIEDVLDYSKQTTAAGVVHFSPQRGHES